MRIQDVWTWIIHGFHMLAKRVMISINPDAHSMDGINDIQWGVAAARKGGLPVDQCLNAKDAASFGKWLSK